MVSQKTGFVGDIKSGVQSEACAKPFLIGREDLVYMSHLLLLGKFEYGGGPIFKVVLEC